jgi:transcriptional regulator of acetoin/glycerol metabolism
MLGTEAKISHGYASGEAKEIITVLHSCEGRIGDAAKALNISRSTLWWKMNNLGIKTNDYKRSS